MDELREKLRQHYDRQSLSTAATERILALGHAAAKERFYRRLAIWSIAAVLALVAGTFTYLRVKTTDRLIGTGEVEIAMQGFFNQPGHPIARVSPNLSELRTWLQQHGAPTDGVIPDNFEKLPAFGCHVLEVGRQSVYLICFVLDPASSGAATANDRNAAMKKPQTLVHFVSVPASAFKNSPPVGARVVISKGAGGWMFAEWRRGDVVYIAGGELSPDRLRQLVASL